MAIIHKYMGTTATQELINLVKAALAKKQDIIQFVEMPEYATYVGRTIEYVGASTAKYTQGHFYRATNFGWEEVYKGLDSNSWQIVDAMPLYADADFETIYFVPDSSMKLAGYVKSETPNKFYEISGSNSGWEVVSSLPAWTDATTDIIYFVIDDASGQLKGYIKNENIANEFYQLEGSAPKAVLKKYAESEHYNPDAEYDEEGSELELDGLEIAAFKDAEIRTLYEEV